MVCLDTMVALFKIMNTQEKDSIEAVGNLLTTKFFLAVRNKLEAGAGDAGAGADEVDAEAGAGAGEDEGAGDSNAPLSKNAVDEFLKKEIFPKRETIHKHLKFANSELASMEKYLQDGIILNQFTPIPSILALSNTILNELRPLQQKISNALQKVNSNIATINNTTQIFQSALDYNNAEAKKSLIISQTAYDAINSLNIDNRLEYAVNVLNA